MCENTYETKLKDMAKLVQKALGVVASYEGGLTISNSTWFIPPLSAGDRLRQEADAKCREADVADAKDALIKMAREVLKCS